MSLRELDSPGKVARNLGNYGKVEAWYYTLLQATEVILQLEDLINLKDKIIYIEPKNRLIRIYITYSKW